MELIRSVLSDSIKFNRIVLLQGKDYPLYSPHYIHSFFKKRNEEEFCFARNISSSRSPGDYIKCCCYWHMDNKKFTHRLLHWLNKKIKIKYRSGVFKRGKEKWECYHGWAQFAVTAECAKYCLDVYETNKSYNCYMKHRFPPDEIYMQTIVYNSKFKDRISSYQIQPRKKRGAFNGLNLTYFEYPIKVEVFTNPNELNELRQTGALFIRKVMLPQSESLLDKIDETI